MLARLAQIPSMVAAGLAGTNSESSITVLVPRSTSRRAALPEVAPPRKTQLRKVMLVPVTFTNPWKSRPLMTVPLVENVWSPLTAVSTVPGSTPVLPGPGLPVRGADRPAADLRRDGVAVALRTDGAAEGETGALGEAEPAD